LNTDSESLPMTDTGSEFLTDGASHRIERFAKSVRANGWMSSGVAIERVSVRWRGGWCVDTPRRGKIPNAVVGCRNYWMYEKSDWKLPVHAFQWTSRMLHLSAAMSVALCLAVLFYC